MYLIGTALPPPNQDLYFHIRVVIGILVGLCITTLLGGFARFVHHPKRQAVSMLRLGMGTLGVALDHSLLVVGISADSGSRVELRTTLVRYSAYFLSFGIEYPIRISVNLAMCVVGVFTTSRRVQFALLFA